MPFESVNPTTGERIRSYPSLDAAGVEAALERAAAAFETWRNVSFDERSARMRHAARILEDEAPELGAIMTREMGKPIGAGEAEAEKCAWACRFYADHAASFLADETVGTDAEHSFVRYEPLGPVLAIMPWNFPFWQVFRFAAPALMAGNVGLLKHAPNVPACALAIEDVFRRAGFPDGVFQNLFVEVERVDELIRDPRVRAATVTGSRRAGSAVAATAGGEIKKSVLELGGSDPLLVLPSADLERAAATAVKARTINSGQSCIAAKRIIVHEEVAEPFAERFVEGMRDLVVGDPTEPESDVGPIAREDLLETLADQVDRSVEAGAEVRLGGERLDRKGFFYPPTVLARIPEGCPAYEEELFGPVASLFQVPDLEAAIGLANDTPYGLGAAAWTRDADERDRLVRELEAGVVFVNGLVASDPRLPFGGVKESGYGRELGVHGIREFVNVKTVWVEAGA